MIFAVIIIAVVAGVAYFHYAQGFFSATLSTICAVTAAVIAVGYHEVVVFSLLQGAAADYAHALCLGALFAGVYIVLRVLLDKAIPGNLRLPVMVDRVGGAAMGVVAGIFTAGVVALVAQMMPFGPTIGGFERFALEDRPEMNVPPAPGGGGYGRARNVDINEQMTEDTFAAERRAKLIIPVDDMLLGFVDMVSTGSFAAEQPFSKVHPDYPTELFGQRIGIQVGGKQTAMNMPGKTPQVTLADPGLFRIDADLGGKNAIDNELPQLHQRPITYTRNPNQLQLAVRLVFNKDASDADTLVRLSLGSVRLVADGKNYFPIGTLEDGKLFLSKMDDFHFVSTKTSDGAVDFLFVIDEPTKVINGWPKDAEQSIKNDVFIEAKRLARIDLSGKPITAGIRPTELLAVQRKPDVTKAVGKADAPAASTEFSYRQIVVGNKLLSAVNVGTPDKDVKDATLPSGTVSVTNREIIKLEINPTQSMGLLGQGENAIDTLHVPAGRKLVQLWGDPGAGDGWDWTTLNQWELIDSKGAKYKPVGAWAKVSQDNADRMVACYSATGNPPELPSAQGRPQDCAVLFLVPGGTMMKHVTYKNKLVAELDQQVQ